MPTSPRLARRRQPPQHRCQHLPLQLATPTLVTELTTALTTHHRPAHLLRVEITEGTAVTDLARAIGKLHQLTDAGIAVELDDYGTGYSSLSMLRDLPLTTVKIDKTFIDTIDTNPTDARLVQGVITTANALGLPSSPKEWSRADKPPTTHPGLGWQQAGSNKAASRFSGQTRLGAVLQPAPTSQRRAG